MAVQPHHSAALCVVLCLLVLFMPGIGDYRWAGLVGFLYVGLPWYILAVRDNVRELRRTEALGHSRWRPRSPTLFAFGLVTAAIGVAIDLYLVYVAIVDPDPLGFLALLARLLLGFPFLGFGASLLYLSIGIRPGNPGPGGRFDL